MIMFILFWCYVLVINVYEIVFLCYLIVNGRQIELFIDFKFCIKKG